METDTIDKTDAASRLIQEAVGLFFGERDIVAIHTLVASAHQILFDLGKKQGVTSVVKNLRALQDHDVQSFLKSVNYPYNFFKHADRDPDSKIDVGPLGRLTQDFLMENKQDTHSKNTCLRTILLGADWRGSGFLVV